MYSTRAEQGSAMFTMNRVMPCLPWFLLPEMMKTGKINKVYSSSAQRFTSIHHVSLQQVGSMFPQSLLRWFSRNYLEIRQKGKEGVVTEQGNQQHAVYSSMQYFTRMQFHALILNFESSLKVVNYL